MNGSLLNSSMNGSSIQLLNKSNKINLNNNIIENNINSPFVSKLKENEGNKLSQEETVDSLMNFVIDILPDSHKFSLIFIFINIFVYLIICVIEIYEAFNQKDKYNFAINLAMNILERVPRITELVLYSTVTTILNKTDLILPTKHQSPYLEYFKIDSLYYSEEMMNTFFQKNLYGQILKDNLKLKYNLENYLYENKYSLFKNVQYWEKMMNKIGDFCINLSLGGILTSGSYIMSNYSNLYELMEEINYQALICKTQITGMKNSGIKIEFNYILQEITTKYIEFIIFNKTNEENLNQARLNFMDINGFERAMSDIKIYFVLYFNTIAYSVKKDLEIENNHTIFNQIIYWILYLILHIEITISLIIIIAKEEKYKKLFSYFAKISKDDNKYI